MKFYESHYEDYLQAIEKYNIHPEMESVYRRLPSDNKLMQNIIVYGPSGVGKYSQVLKIIKPYSPSELKYDKKITVQTEKGSFIYRISDIHYEVDMSLLGCNSKLIWHELFFQIIDIIAVKHDKMGIIVCKNFHTIHSELLEIFYSYIQHYNHTQSNLKINFIIISEHISFLPKNIINACQVINVGRPTRHSYERIVEIKTPDKENIAKTKKILDLVELDEIINIKEILSFSLLERAEDLPKDIFNTICDNIVQELLHKKQLSFTDFRDTLYDILTYNLDISECLWYIISFLIRNQYLHEKDISDTLETIFVFLKYYNNNYRPIYHLESIMFYIITKIRNYDELS